MAKKGSNNLQKTCNACLIWKLGRQSRTLFSYLKFKFIASENFVRNRRLVFHSQVFFTFSSSNGILFRWQARGRKKLILFLFSRPTLLTLFRLKACDKHEFLRMHTGFVRSRHLLHDFLFGLFLRLILVHSRNTWSCRPVKCSGKSPLRLWFFRYSV